MTNLDLEEFWQQMYDAAFLLEDHKGMEEAAKRCRIYVVLNNRYPSYQPGPDKDIYADPDAMAAAVLSIYEE